MSGQLSIERPARLDSLDPLLRFVDAACGQLEADNSTVFALRLAVEEVCMNLIRHGYRDMAPGPIRVELFREPDHITVRISDRARPFDPARAPAPDLDSDLEHRRIGGLGWHLVRHYVDDIEYHTDPIRGNVLTLKKRTPRESHD
jgi:serine/threonine-protein kinase RsbW